MISLFLRRITRNHCIKPALGAVLAFALVSALAVSAHAQPRSPEFFDDPAFDDYTEPWNRGEYGRALEIVQEKIDRAPTHVYVKWMRDRAALRFILGRVDEAINDMEHIESQLPEPVHALELALLYKYRGRMDEYRSTLRRALSQAQRSWRYSRPAENYVALARVQELQGQNPKTILSSTLGTLLDNEPVFIPAFVLAGDIAYRKHDYKLASEYYEKALAKEPENQEALAGLAECYWKSHDERLEETLAKITKLNPNNLRAKAIQVETLLDTGKEEEALELVESGLAINPVHLEFRSLKSAALFLKDDVEGMERVQKETLAFNPHCSEIFRTTGRIASRHYRFVEAADFQRRALEIDPEDHEARALYGFDLIRLGNEKEGREQLKMAFDADPYNVQVFNLLKVLDEIAGFATVERGPFVLQLPKDEELILAEDALGLLEEAYEKYQAKYQIELDTPVLVQVFDSHDDFMVRSVGLPGSIGYMGICFGRLITMDSPSARNKWSMNWRSVLWHEFVHVITLQKTKNRMPRWLSEGISVYEETEYSPAWGQRLDPQYKAIVEEDSLPGLSDLEKYFTQAKTPAHLMFGYYLAGEFVHFYVDTYGFDALREALRLIGEGGSAEAALAKAAGKELPVIDENFRTFTKLKTASLANLPAVEGPKRAEFDFSKRDTGATLETKEWSQDTSTFTLAMERGAKSMSEERWEDAEREYKKAHEAFPDYMGADAPLRQLIRIYEKTGRTEDLKASLEQEIDWNQSDFPACQKLVGIYRDEENWPEVVRVADWALGIDPFDVGMRQALLEGLRKTGKDDEALTTLAQLRQLDAVRAIDYRLQRVEILMKKEQWADAKQETIAVLESTPHFWDAQQKLLEIIEKGAAPE